MTAYGLVQMMEMYASLHLLQDMFDKVENVPPLEKPLSFPRIYIDESLCWEKQCLATVGPTANADNLRVLAADSK